MLSNYISIVCVQNIIFKYNNKYNGSDLLFTIKIYVYPT